MGTRQARAAQWLEHVTRWRASGLSQSAYCAREALSESAFGYWVAKANKGAGVYLIEGAGNGAILLAFIAGLISILILFFSWTVCYFGLGLDAFGIICWRSFSH